MPYITDMDAYQSCRHGDIQVKEYRFNGVRFAYEFIRDGDKVPFLLYWTRHHLYYLDRNLDGKVDAKGTGNIEVPCLGDVRNGPH